MSTIGYSVIDAFADTPYSGNPAGVLFLERELSEAQMVAIAREINASETSFVTGLSPSTYVAGASPLRLRWFTPNREVSFCGHATLAAAHALLDAVRDHAAAADRRAIPLGIRFQSATDPLELTADSDGLLWLKMPPPEYRQAEDFSKALELLGLRAADLDPRVPPVLTRENDLILVVASYFTVMEMRPKFAELARWGDAREIRGFACSTTAVPAGRTQVHSRFFAPSFGVDEDPVTGSLHGPLTTLLATSGLAPVKDGRADLTCAQGGPGGRGGVVRARVDLTGPAPRVTIGGRCFTTLTGRLRIPQP